MKYFASIPCGVPLSAPMTRADRPPANEFVARRGAMRMTRARLRAGKSLYYLGHRADLLVARSDDRGETWSDPAALTQCQSWHQSVLSRSGDERAQSAHDGNLITFHRVQDFRGLVY